MNIFHKPQVKPLSEWLEIATRRIATPAKERIKVEIEGHYGEAVEGYRQNGSSETVAQFLALADLGDAKTAAKRFRERHLTVSDAQLLEISAKAGRNLLTLLVGCLLFGTMAIDQLPLPKNALIHFSYPVLSLVCEFFVLVVLPAACAIVTKCDKLMSNLRSLVLMQSFSGLSPGLSLYFLFIRLPPYPFRFFVNIIFSFALLSHCLTHLYLWNKLGKVGTIRS